jgi:HK97 family phage portal protein
VLITDGTNLAAMPVSRATALAVGAVYRALAIYADLIGTMPVHRYRGDVQLPPPAFVDHPAGVPIGWTDEIGQVIWSLLLRGNAYLVVTSVDQTTGYPTTFYVADPDTVTVHRVADGIEYRVSFGSGYVNDAVYLNPSPDELLHVRWQTPPGSLLGIGILDAAGGPTGVLSGAFYADRYASDVMANPVPPVALEHPQRLDTEQANELQTQWLGSLARVRAVPAVLSGGVKITPIAVTPRDVQLIESRQYNATAIATLFGLPPHYVGGRSGDSLTYSTVEGENTRLWTDALQPMAIRLERNIGGAWTPNGQRLRFVPDAILRSQTLDRFNAHKIALDAGFETLDEVRALENLPPLDEEPAPAPPALPPAPPALPAPGGAP